MSPTAALALPLIASVCALLPVVRAESPSDFSRASILERAPFANGPVAAKPATKDSRFVLRGFYASEKGLEVSLTKVETQESAWVLVGDDAAKWPVPEADPRAGTAELRFGEEKFHLTLEKSLAAPETKLAIPDVQPAAPVAGAPEWKSRRLFRDKRNEELQKLVQAGEERAKIDHPEWYNGNRLTNQQSDERREYRSSVMDAARRQVRERFPYSPPGANTPNAEPASEE